MRKNEALCVKVRGFLERNTEPRHRAGRMYKFVFSFMLLLTFCFLPKTEASQELPFDNPSILISMDFKDASLKDVLKIFSVQSGLNFIASEGVQSRNVTLYLDKVPIKEAMDKLFSANNLSYELDRDSDIFIIKDWGKAKMETVTRVFRLKYVSVSTSPLNSERSSNGVPSSPSGVTNVVTKLLTEYGSLIEDPRTNSLIVTDIPSRIPMIAKAIEALDVSVPQVMLEVEMLDVSKNLVDKLGFDWSDAGSYSIKLISPAMGTLFPLHNLFPQDQRPDFHANDAAGTMSLPTNLQVVFDFLRTQSDTRYLARPRILTLNNETAEIKITTQETIGVNQTTVTGNTPTTNVTPERAETGVILRVTPQINPETGEITMFIVPTVKDTSTSSFINTGTTFYKDPEERSTKSTVRIKNGDTVIIGGLIRNEKTETITKLPFLGDIPLLGAAFRHKDRTKDKERELLVFITPRIVKNSSIEASTGQSNKDPIASFPRREQAVATLAKRESTINTFLSDFEKRE